MASIPDRDNPAIRRAASYPLRFATRILYADMDAFRHLNNGATGRYFEEGRAQLNMAVFGYGCMVDPGDLQLLFANSTFEYLRQGHYPGEVAIGTAVARIGNTSYQIVQAAFQDDACFALSRAVMVKALRGIPEPITPEERARLERLTMGAEA
jgi:acyl-CoA thioester hydrolase